MKLQDLLTEERIVNFDQSYGNFVVVMGSPGAGKDFLVNNLLDLKDFKEINVDNFREMLARKLGYDLGNPEHNKMINKLTKSTGDPDNPTMKFFRNFLQTLKKENRDRLPNIVFNTTGKRLRISDELTSITKEIGYETTLVFVDTTISIALRRNLERERTLDPELVIKYHEKVKENFPKLMGMFDNVWSFMNDRLWDAFKGEEEYETKGDTKVLVKRKGKYERPVNRIKKIK